MPARAKSAAEEPQTEDIVEDESGPSDDERFRYVESFDPRRYLTRISGSDYLEVKWRLYWLRAYDPDAKIHTELISHENSVAVFKAHVMLSDGGGRATGWGSEGYDDFRDYLEKAETKAVGRALAALGFGTQFTNDYDFADGGDGVKLVDAPVRLATQRQMVDRADQRQTQPGEGITDRQLQFIRQLAREKGYSDASLDAKVKQVYGAPDLVRLTRRDASAVIERFKDVPRKTAPEPEMEPVVNQVAGEIIEEDEIPF